MKKLICLLLILCCTITVLAGCNNENKPNPDVDGGGNDVVADRDSTLLDIPNKTIDSLSANENLFIAHKKLLDAGSYSTTSSGTSVSFGVTQTIDTERTVIGNNVFKQAVSTSTFVKTAEQRYVMGDNFIVRSGQASKNGTVKWDSVASNLSEEGFLAKYGYTGSEMSGFILNDDTITSSKLVSSSENKYVFEYILDNNTATTKMVKEMLTSSGSSQDPVFTRACLIVTMDSNWNLITVETDHQYKVKLLGEFNCSENVIESYNEVGGITTLPESVFFSSYLDKPVGDGDDKYTAFTAIMEILSPYINTSGATALPLNLTATNGSDTVAEGQVVAWIDLMDINKTTLDITLDYVNASGLQLNNMLIKLLDSNLYVNYGNVAKGKAEVDSLFDAIAKLSSLLGGDKIEDGDLNLEDMADAMTLTMNGKDAVITIDLGGSLPMNIVVNAKDNDGKLVLSSVKATIGSIVVDLEPTNGYNPITISGDYADLMGVFELITSDNSAFNISLEAVVAGKTVVVDAVVVVDFVGKTISLQADIFGDTLKVMLGEGGIYLKQGEMALRSDDVSDLIGLLATVFPNLGESNPDVELDNPLEKVKLDVTADAITLENIYLLGMNLSVNLACVEDKWVLGDITLGGEKLDLAVAPTTATVDMGDLTSYIDVSEIIGDLLPMIKQLNSDNFTLELWGKVEISSMQVNYTADLVIDGSNFSLDIDGFTTNNDQIINASILLVGDKLYINFNGIKTTLDVGGSSNTSGSVGGVAGTVGSIDFDAILDLAVEYVPELQPIIDKVNELLNSDKLLLSDINLLSIKQFDYVDNKLTVVVDGSAMGLVSNLKLVAAIDDNMIDATVYMGEVAFSCAFMVSEGTKVTAPTEQYFTSFNLNVGGVDLLATVYGNGEVNVSGKVLGDSVHATVSGETIYLQYGKINLALAISDIGSIATAVMPLLGDLGIDLNALLGSLVAVNSIATMSTPTNSNGLAMTWYTGELTLYYGNFEAVLYLSDKAIVESLQLCFSDTVVDLTLSQTKAVGADLTDSTKYVDLGETVVPALKGLIVSGNGYKLAGTIAVDIKGIEIALDVTALIDFVDSNNDGNVELYASVDIERYGNGKNTAFNDNGGYSYLRYNGSSNTIRLYNSADYDSGFVSAVTAFTNIETITSWLNVSDTLVELLVPTAQPQAVNSLAVASTAKLFSIDSYVTQFKQEDSALTVGLDLSAVNEVLSVVTIVLNYNDSTKALAINGTTAFLDGLADVSIDLTLASVGGKLAYNKVTAK